MPTPRLHLLLAPLLAALVTVSVVSADEADTARLEALRQAVSQIGQPVSAPLAHARMSWTPHERFSEVGEVAEVLYGPRLLVARYDHPAVQQETACQAFWTYNGQALSSGDCLMQPGHAFVTNGVRRQDAPLLPGTYRVVFRTGTQEVAQAEMRILPPAPLGERKAEAVLLSSLVHLQQALQQLDASQGQAAGREAAQAVPLLATVVLARPQDADAAAMLELSQALVAVGQMEANGLQKRAPQTLDWAERAAAHARSAETLAREAALKATCKRIADTLQEALPKLAGAAAAG